ncbi:Cell surface spherulin 4-like protein [Penicillium canariense]|uniref:Cell surface spherulin 4-like protein n=1 Tax=Penicillium canariense TaxID=189055 RepID=A0A9W9I892_9EURO|nr:Cell surface spherulin 4-like protein [Penicillium canariense]KAJ5168633.1 Cell surface spherulin 4-like protein [Penicillium canariense]
MRAFAYLVGTAIAMASAVSATGILIPLYIWPADDSTWRPVYNAISSYPDILFQVIVNPDSGPGGTTYPDENLITGVAKLNSYDNVQVIGYVATDYAERDFSEVDSQISTYSGWSAYTTKNITVSGIFFDEAPSTNDDTKISYMQGISATAKSSNLNTVIFNPGTKLEPGSATEYFKAADLIVEFEKSYSAWLSAIPANEFSANGTYYKDAVILYGAPLKANYDDVIHEAQTMGLGAAYLTESDDYMSVDTVPKVAASFVAQ